MYFCNYLISEWLYVKQGIEVTDLRKTENPWRFLCKHAFMSEKSVLCFSLFCGKSAVNTCNSASKASNKKGFNHTIAVYPNRRTEQVKELQKDNRVDFIAKADYSAGSELEDIVKEIITNIVASEKLISRHAKQIKEISKTCPSKK